MNFPVVDVLKPSAAGRFYPRDPDELRSEVRRYLDEAPVSASAKPVLAVLVPHAGYVFSGPVAGCSFRHVENENPDTVLFIALSHQGTKGGCVYAGRFFETPLGLVEVDEELSRVLLQSGEPFHSTVDPYIREHSVEVNLPFVQILFPKAQVASILVTYTEPDLCRRMGEKIAEVLRCFSEKKVLIVVSSDMSHYPDYDTANRVDVDMLKSLETLDPTFIYQELQRLESTPAPNLHCVMCGSAAMLTAIEASRALGAQEARVLSYRNSGDSAYGDHERVVGYGAFAIYRPDSLESSHPGRGSEETTWTFTQEEQKTLLAIARNSIQAVLTQKQFSPEPPHPRLQVERGLFVTLKKQGILRGCLGRFDSNGLPLYKLVSEIAAESAIHDMRFSPVTEDELSLIDIQISMLSPVEAVQDINEIIIGRHGLKIRGRNAFGMKRTGTLLPQVACEHQWDVAQFLCATCQKTGIEPEAWKDSQTEIFKYEAAIFGDLDFAQPPYIQDKLP